MFYLDQTLGTCSYTTIKEHEYAEVYTWKKVKEHPR